VKCSDLREEVNLDFTRIDLPDFPRLSDGCFQSPERFIVKDHWYSVCLIATTMDAKGQCMRFETFGIFRKFLDLTIPLADGLEAKILERPGRWMATATLEKLMRDLRQIARNTIASGPLDYGIFAGETGNLDACVITIIYRKSDGMPVAFNALPLIHLDLAGKAVDVLHLGLVLVDPGMRSQGLSWVLYGLTCFLLFLRNQFRPLWISSVTQVPAVAGMVAETFSDVFPSPDPLIRRTLRHQLIARDIMANHRHIFGVGDEAGFDADRFVITNAYTGGSDNLKKTFDEAPKHRKPDYNDFCRRELDYQRGDDLIQIGQIDINAARKYLTESVPRNSLAGLGLAGAIVMLQRLALPLLYWADNTRQWGILRPSNK
jgi:hypothetical protein